MIRLEMGRWTGVILFIVLVVIGAGAYMLARQHFAAEAAEPQNLLVDAIEARHAMRYGRPDDSSMGLGTWAVIIFMVLLLIGAVGALFADKAGVMMRQYRLTKKNTGPRSPRPVMPRIGRVPQLEEDTSPPALPLSRPYTQLGPGTGEGREHS